MFDKVKIIKLYIGDLHLGEGADSPNEDFKYHPPGVRMDDTQNDYVLDIIFADFIDWVLANTGHCPEVRLHPNGDTFDFSAIGLPGKGLPFPYEEDAIAKLKMIMAAHTVFFDSLAKFCSAGNTRLKFFVGNHDLQLSWPSVQKMLTERISPQNPEKISFLHEEYDHGTYTRHGEDEPHTKINHAKPIITAMEIAKLPEIIKTGKINSALRDVLDVSMGHYLNADLMYNLKKYNYLIGRMHVHDFVWIDGVKRIFFKSWFRSRWFFFYGAYYLLRTFYRYAFRVKFWHIKMKLGLMKILRVLYWTFTGVLSGHTPKDSAIKILHKQEDVDCVLYSHEHRYASEVLEINGQTKTYINTGTWTPQFKEKQTKEPAPWKRLRWLQKSLLILRNLFTGRDVELMWRCPVGVETIDDCGNVSRQLAEWDKDKKTLKELS